MFLSLLFAIIVGAIAGWFASKLVAGQSFGLTTNIVVGIVGGVLARLIFPAMGLGHGFVAAIFQATIGAVILLILLSVAKRL